jgi:glucose-6-phosphate 1-dehydrogenase
MSMPPNKIETPTAIVLLGATGDLAQKKLLPALMDLYAKELLPDRFHIVAFSKADHTHESYRLFAREQINKKSEHPEPLLTTFLAQITYVQGQFDEPGSYERIKHALDAYDEHIGMCTSKLFYLAVPPTYYETIFERLASVKLEQPCIVGEGWTRILVEKPFGNDLTHARHLDQKLSQLFREEQIYRIDHYLAKDAIQNILSFRFSNTLFSHTWNSEYIDAVYINVFEKFDVATRGAFFDGVGALRDVGQNHMLQMLALIAMEYPETLTADTLRQKRTEVLRALKIPGPIDLDTHIVKGQYDGYLDVPHVAPHSKTETYFAVKTFLDTPRWRGVPFYLEHGKAMERSSVEISIRFKSSEQCVCGTDTSHDHPNFVRFSISPQEKITVRFWVRSPGTKYALEPNDLVFDRSMLTESQNVIADAYEEVLFDALSGDQTLFVSNAEQEAAWNYITAILSLWQSTTPLPYTRGETGPASALKEEITHTIHLFA